MSKSLKIFLAVLALISVGFSLAFYFEWGPFAKREVTPKPTPTPTQQQISSTQINSSSDCVILDKENCSLGKPIYENNQLIAVGFNIPKGDGVYSPFKAKYEKNAPTSLVIDGIGYPSVELMDISRNDWGTIDTRSYFSVVAYSQVPIAIETLEKKQSITVLPAIGKVRGSFNLILTFKEYNRKTNEWKTNIDLLKQYFPNLESK